MILGLLVEVDLTSQLALPAAMLIVRIDKPY
jgi:hypothetical protein